MRLCFFDYDNPGRPRCGRGADRGTPTFHNSRAGWRAARRAMRRRELVCKDCRRLCAKGGRWLVVVQMGPTHSDQIGLDGHPIWSVSSWATSRHRSRRAARAHVRKWDRRVASSSFRIRISLRRWRRDRVVK